MQANAKYNSYLKCKRKMLYLLSLVIIKGIAEAIRKFYLLMSYYHSFGQSSGTFSLVRKQSSKWQSICKWHISGKGVIFLNLDFVTSNRGGMYFSKRIDKIARSEGSLISIQLVINLSKFLNWNSENNWHLLNNKMRNRVTTIFSKLNCSHVYIFYFKIFFIIL